MGSLAFLGIYKSREKEGWNEEMIKADTGPARWLNG